MRSKQRYNLTVRGLPVTLEFSKINDSRRLPSYGTDKKPNLFNLRGATECRLELPHDLTPPWWKDKYAEAMHSTGLAFCHWSDKWNSQKGRHESLRDAIRRAPEDIHQEIWIAFLAEEEKRIKVKGLARTPKKPKARKPGMRQILTRLADLLERMEQPRIASQKDIEQMAHNLFPDDVKLTSDARTSTEVPEWDPVTTGEKCPQCGADMVEGYGCKNMACANKTGAWCADVFRQAHGFPPLPKEETK